MKGIFSLAIALVALFSVNSVVAQRAHFVGTPCYDATAATISGKVAGVGTNSADYTIGISGSYGCQNPSGKKTPPAWTPFSLTGIPLSPDPNSPGNYLFTVDVSNFQSVCHSQGASWTTIFNDVTATLYNGTRAVDTKSVTTCK